MQRKHYQWDASEYERHSVAQLQWAGELIAKLHLKGHETILDLGCGDGKVTAAIAALLPEGHVLGIDNSAQMIQLAQRRHSGANLSFELLDIRDLNWTERFDVVFSNAVLHWIKRHLPVLVRVHKALKKGGRMLLQMGGSGNARDVVSVMDRLIHSKCGQHFKQFTFPYGFYGVQDYTGWLVKAGFSHLRVELIPKDMQHQDRHALAGWIRSTWLPYLERIPDRQTEPFITAVVDEYLNRHPPDDQGIIHVAMVRLEVEAVKPYK
jgi:trans-aconitate methyltransferase